MGKLKLHKINHYLVCTKSSLQGTWSAKCPLLVHCRPVLGPLVCMVWSADYTQPKGLEMCVLAGQLGVDPLKKNNKNNEVHINSV